MFDDFVRLIREIYQTEQFTPLHEPRFFGTEKEYLLDSIDSTFVPSFGSYVDRFKNEIAAHTGAEYATATVNGTAHCSVAGRGRRRHRGYCPALDLCATCNAVKYCGAEPVFVGVGRHNPSLSLEHLRFYLDENAEVREGSTWNRTTGKCIALPAHAHLLEVG